MHGLTKKWKPLRVSVETVAYQTTLYKNYREWAVRANAQIPWVELKRGRKNKRQRIMALQPRVERGDFHVEEDIKNIDWLIE